MASCLAMTIREELCKKIRVNQCLNPRDPRSIIKDNL